MIPLYYTSFLCIIPAVYAYYKNIAWMHHSSIATTMFSILHHSKFRDNYKGKKIIALLDILTGNCSAIKIAIDLYSINNNIKYIYYLSITIALLLFSTNLYRDKTLAYKLHGYIHVLYAIGTCAAIEVYNKN